MLPLGRAGCRHRAGHLRRGNHRHALSRLAASGADRPAALAVAAFEAHFIAAVLCERDRLRAAIRIKRPGAVVPVVGVLAGVEGDGDLTACVRMALVVPHAAQRRRNLASIRAVVFTREGDWNQRRAAPRPVLAGVEAFAA